MSYSKLTDYIKLSPNCTKPRNNKIDAIVIHHMAGDLTVEACGADFAAPARQAPSNYGVGTDGRVACYVEEENRAWTTGSREIDNRAITIEVANCGGAPDWKVSDQALEATIALCVDICKRYGLRLNYTGDRTGNLHMHKWYQATACPGPYLSGKFSYIAQEVNRRLDGVPAEPGKPAEKAGYSLTMRNLRKGCEGEDVKALQILLIGRGFTCGRYGPDGDFGPATDSAVRDYQQAERLDVDGIVGPATMASLLGV